MIKMGHFDYTVSEVNSHSSWSLCITHMEPLFYGAHAVVSNLISDTCKHFISKCVDFINTWLLLCITK
jgi:hypothetical protein